jgi:hypothetical protein
MKKRAFEGTVRVRFDAESGRIFLDRGTKDSTLTAMDADKIAKIALDGATANKAGLDRWSFYVRGENEKLGTDPKATLDPKTVAKALKAGLKPSLVAARFGKPALWLEDETTKASVKVSKYQDLA